MGRQYHIRLDKFSLPECRATHLRVRAACETPHTCGSAQDVQCETSALPQGAQGAIRGSDEDGNTTYQRLIEFLYDQYIFLPLTGCGRS